MLTTTCLDLSFDVHSYNMCASEDISLRPSFHEILDFCPPKMQHLSPPQDSLCQNDTAVAPISNRSIQECSPSPVFYNNTQPAYVIPSHQQESLIPPVLPNSWNSSVNSRRNTYDATVNTSTGLMLSHETPPTSYPAQQPSSSPSVGLPMMNSSFYPVKKTVHDSNMFIPPSVSSQAYQQPYYHNLSHNRVYSSPSSSSLSLHQFRSVPNLSPLLNSSYEMNSPMLSRRCSFTSFSRPPSPQCELLPYHQQHRSSSPTTTATSAGNKKYVCRICHKRFTRPSSLTTHIYSHTGEKPFKCPIENCGRSFSVVSNLRRHAKVHGLPNFDNYSNNSSSNDASNYKTIRRTMSTTAITMNSRPSPPSVI